MVGELDGILYSVWNKGRWGWETSPFLEISLTRLMLKIEGIVDEMLEPGSKEAKV